MSAHTTYMSLLFVGFTVGFVFNVFVLRANARTILFHALCCAGSVVIAGYMSEWMLWASCGMIAMSLIATGVIVHKFKLVEFYRQNKHRLITEEEVDLEDCPPEVQAQFKKYHG